MALAERITRPLSSWRRSQVRVNAISETHPQHSSKPNRRRAGAVLGVVVGSALVLTACFSSSSAKDKHAVFHDCPSSSVTLQELPSEGHTRYKTSGCGHEEVFSCIAAKCRSARILVLRQHAADFNCKLEKITTEEPSEGSFVSKGCGKTGHYTCREVDRDVIKCDKQKK
jgi:hypothetical protein